VIVVRTAIVTGAARGIGAATGLRLARAGRRVALIDREPGACQPVVDEIRRDGGSAMDVAADVADEVAVRDAVAAVAAEMGPPTILVNNAGILRDNLLFKMSVDDWDDVVAVHLRGAFLVTRAVQGHMVEEGWGRIVSMSSTSALGNRGQVNYAAAKAGLQGFTKTLALELGPFGITANAVAPGFIATDMTAETAERMGITFDEFRERIGAQTAVRRIGLPEDVASAVAFLTSEESSFISGQVLYVAGGPTD
jgi:3-oxoacyl-[acyl-carrier protein] reductase